MMRITRTPFYHKILLTVFLFSIGVFCCYPDPGTLPEALLIDLHRLEETWNILDQYAKKIWPGWNDYRDAPFMFNYPNGVRMLVGHPSPTDGFQLVSGVLVGGKKVYLDRSREIPLVLAPPLYGGGGVLSFGKEKTVATVRLNMRMVAPVEKIPGENPGSPEEGKKYHWSERQILVNIHEIFHCFQKARYKYTVGSLEFNADANYAIYAEIEGLALEKAYLEVDRKKAMEYLEDFLVARKLKQRSMTETERLQEEQEEFMEGTAVYSTFRTLELIKTGYRPRLEPAQDAYFFAFADRQNLMEGDFESLRMARADTMNTGKYYPFGCFQGLLLSRFFPGWQENFLRETKKLRPTLAAFLDISPAKENRIIRRLKSKYEFEEISSRHSKVIKERDEAYRLVQERRGRVYVINFKPVREFFKLVPRGESFRLGLMNIFPGGIEKLKLHDVVLVGNETPMVRNQLYHIKWIDTEAAPKENSFGLKYRKKAGPDIYYDAEFKTKGFTLRAPKIRVKVLPWRVKVYVLEKIKL